MVEAELGRISGKEDYVTVALIEQRMTRPEQAAEFVQATGAAALAVCIGNVHGRYPDEPRLDFERLAAIRGRVAVPLVLHGTSGLPDAMVRRAVELGVCKFNINTSLRQAYLQTVKLCLDAEPTVDVLDVMDAAIEAMSEIVHANIQLFGSANHA